MERKYTNLVGNISLLLEKGRREAVRSINNILIKTYWEIGRNIVEYEQGGKEKALHGLKLLDNLSSDLTKKYEKGFSVDNLERMRKFYLMFPKSAPLVRKLSWTHHLLIMRVKNPDARSFYLIEAEKENWSKRELERQINSMLFERLALSRDKKKIKELSLKGQIIEKPSDLIKDPYVLEFLKIPENYKYNEKEFEEKIIDKLQLFLLELGKGFSFIARQFRITLGNKHFYVDLVFYLQFNHSFLTVLQGHIGIPLKSLGSNLLVL